MHRLLLIESSPTLRRGMEKLLHRYGFEVTSTPATDDAARLVGVELQRGLRAVLLGWTTAPDAVCHAIARRLADPDCRDVALLVLAADPSRVDPGLASTRPHTAVRRLQRPSEVPRLV